MAHVIDSRGVDLGDITNADLLTYYRREPGFTVGGVTTPSIPARSSADILPVWAANTIYVAGQEILDPSGVTILVRQSTGTSRSTYDSTEQALWSAAGAGGGGGTAVTLIPTAVKTANYTAAGSDLVPVDTTSGNVTVTLPTTPADKTQVGVKHVIRGGTNTVSIAAGGSDVFNKTGGSATATLTLVNQGTVLQYKASSAIWYVVSDDLPLSQLDLRFAAAGSSGSLPANFVSKTAAYTAVAGDYVEADTTSAAFTVTLPTGPAAGAVVAVQKISADANVLTIAPAGGGTIDGDPNATTSTRWAGGVFEHKGSNNWHYVPVGPASGVGAHTHPESDVSNLATDLAALVPKSLIDAKGDLLVGTANDTITRLGAGTDGWVLTSDSSQSTGVKWAASAGGGGGGLLAWKTYDPASLTTYNENSTTLTAIDATNLTVTFTAPASGSVLVRCTGMVQGFASGDYLLFGLVDTGGTQVGRLIGTQQNSGLFVVPFVQVVTGLTSGTSYTWRWAWRNALGTANTGHMYAGGAAGSDPGTAVMEVWSA